MKANYTQDDVINDIQKEIESWIFYPAYSSSFGSLQIFVAQALSAELNKEEQQRLISALKQIQEHLRGTRYELQSQIVNEMKSWKDDLSKPISSKLPSSVVTPLIEIQTIVAGIPSPIKQ